MRKVRTPEGSRYYNLPIGSPITADAIAAAKVRNRGKAAPVAERASGGQSSGGSGGGPSRPTVSSVSGGDDEYEPIKIKGIDVQARKGSRLVPSPNGSKTYAIAPDEMVRVFDADGSYTDLDEELSDRLLERLEGASGPQATGPVGSGTPASPEASAGGIARDPKSLGTSIAERTEADIKEFRQSPITGKHLTEDGKFTPEREALHDEIVARFLEGLPVRENPVQYMNGGGPASGKSSMTKGENGKLLNYPTARTVNEATGEFEEIEGQPQALLLDADSIKLQLPEVQEAVARFHEGRATPEDSKWAGQAHAESSYLSERIHRAALERGHDLIFDGTGNGSIEVMTGRVQSAKDLGYRVEINYLFAEPEVGIERALSRAEETGRVVPEEVIRSTYTKIPGIYQDLVNAGIVDNIRLFDNNGRGGRRQASLVAEGSGEDMKIHDPVAYARFLSSGSRAEPKKFEDATRSVLERSQKVSAEVTPVLSQSLSTSGGSLYEESTPDPTRLNAQIRALAADKGLTPEEAQARMSRAVTYTVESTIDDFATVVQKTLDDFKANGYTPVRGKNGFEDGGVGASVVFANSDGAEFSVDFHTPESRALSTEAVSGILDQMSLLQEDSEAYQVLQSQIASMSKSLQAPKVPKSLFRF